MKWKFREIHPNEVETELTQRDQFHNDDVDLADALVRETIQNSLDASEDSNANVHVRFTLIDKNQGLDKEWVKGLFEGLFPHFDKTEVPYDSVDFENPSILTIEDFGTTGLTGAFASKDKGNFSDFWRRHGRSHKKGSRGGRWGLGKLVYSNSSELRTFFGLTIRNDDKKELLMGQSVLMTHNLNGKEYAPHAFFSEEKDDLFQVPVTDLQVTANFKNNMKLKRFDQPGLSIMIPFPAEELNAGSIMEVAIINYFFPILTRKLSLEISGEILDDTTIRELCNKYAADKIKDAEKLFDFIEACHNTDSENMIIAKPDWRNDGRVAEDDFLEADLEVLRQKFSKGEMVAVRFPIEIIKKDKSKQSSYFDTFLKSEDSVSAGRDLYVRGGITVPGEKKFGERRAFGALVAKDEPISGFLGDAENAAHTRWNPRAEKLKKYRYAAPTLTVIRKSLVQLHDIFSQAVESVDESALLEFFSIISPDEPKTKRKKKKTPVKPKIKIEPKPKPFRLNATADGFSITPSAPIDPEELPMPVRISLAYDIIRGLPFKKYSPYDFNVGEDPIIISESNLTISSKSENKIAFTIDKPDFHLAVSGFDPNRDLIIRASDGK